MLQHLKKQLLEKDDYEAQIARLHHHVADLTAALAAERKVNTVCCLHQLLCLAPIEWVLHKVAMGLR